MPFSFVQITDHHLRETETALTSAIRLPMPFGLSCALLRMISANGGQKIPVEKRRKDVLWRAIGLPLLSSDEIAQHCCEKSMQ